MKTSEFLAELKAKNVRISLYFERVKVEADEDVLTDEMMILLKERKDEILEILISERDALNEMWRKIDAENRKKLPSFRWSEASLF